MVEIIPYTDDDEDQTNWVPLTSTANDATRPAGGASATDAAAADDVSSEGHSDSGAISANNSSPRPGASANKSSHDDVVFVEDADDVSDDEEGWQKLSAESPHPPATAQTSDVYGASRATEQSWSWGKQLITHLTSTTATTSTNDEDDASESADNIVWRRANDLDDADVDAGRTYGGQSNRQASVEEEYDDETTPVLRFSSEEEFDESNLSTEPLRPQKGERLRPEQARFQHVPEQTREQGDQARGRPSVKAKLQETLIHDPLRALPLCFLRRLYHEAKVQCTLAWNSYFEQNDLQTILAPVSLVVIVALLGIALIGAGIFGLGSIVVGTSAQLMLVICSWMAKFSLTMASEVLWVSMCASLVLGVVGWLWCRVGKRTDQINGEAALKGFQVPSVSALLPWVIAGTSPSLCEALVIILSLRTCLSVFASRSDPNECSFSTDGGDDRHCLADTAIDQPSVAYGMSPLIMFSVALLMAAANALIVALAANMMEQHGDDSGASKEDDGRADTTLSSPAGPGAEAVGPTSTSAAAARAYLRKSYQRMQSCIGTCHTVSVLALAALSVTAVLAQALYVHIKEGGNIFFALASHIGSVGCNILVIATGVFVIVTLWNTATEAVARNDTILAGRMTFGELSRIALKKAVIEISSNAVWSGDDTGSSLLGILSDDDGALRLAILEWAIDRWVKSSASEQSVPPAQNARQSPEDPPSAAAAENRQSSFSNFSKDDSCGHSSGDDQGHSEGNGSGDSYAKTGSTSSDHAQILPSYQSLQELIVKLDADETLIPTIGRYREWVYSLPPSRNAAMYVALWKMCPATVVLTSTVLWCATSYAVRRLVLFSWGLDGTSNGCIAFVCTIATITLPLLFLEYMRVRRWWARATVHMENIEYEAQHNNERTQRDLVMILLRADAGDVVTSQSDFNIGFLVDTSNVLLRVWVLQCAPSRLGPPPRVDFGVGIFDSSSPMRYRSLRRGRPNQQYCLPRRFGAGGE